MQELDEKVPEPIDEPGLVIFVRRWNPSDMTLGPFKEITIFGNYRNTIHIVDRKMSLKMLIKFIFRFRLC